MCVCGAHNFRNSSFAQSTYILESKSNSVCKEGTFTFDSFLLTLTLPRPLPFRYTHTHAICIYSEIMCAHYSVVIWVRDNECRKRSSTQNRHTSNVQRGLKTRKEAQITTANDSKSESITNSMNGWGDATRSEETRWDRERKECAHTHLSSSMRVDINC